METNHSKLHAPSILLGVKLSDLASQHDDLRLGVETQLKLADATELAAFVTTDESTMAFVATDIGLYVGRMVTVHGEEGGVEGVITPWSEVVGTRLAFSGVRAELSMVTATIEHPAFRESVSSGRARRALIDFATACTRYQARWPTPRDVST